MDIGVHGAVEADLGRSALSVVEEVQLISCSAVSTPHVHQLLAVQDVVRSSDDVAFCDDLLRPQAVVVVLELHGHAGLAHLLQLSARLPGIGPGAIVRQVADGVIGERSGSDNRIAILYVCSGRIRSELVLPLGIAVGIQRFFKNITHRAGRVGISRLALDIAATVVNVLPGRAVIARSLIVHIIHSGQLPYGVILIARSRSVSVLCGDVPPAVVGIREGEERIIIAVFVTDAGNQRRGNTRGRYCVFSWVPDKLPHGPKADTGYLTGLSN